MPYRDQKELKVVPDGKGMYYIKYANGGQMPASLMGKYTSTGLAQAAIDRYKPTKRRYYKRGKTSSS